MPKREGGGPEWGFTFNINRVIEEDIGQYSGKGIAMYPRFTDLYFTRADVERIKSGGAGAVDDKPLDARERTTVLRIIRALDAMAKLPARGPASSIEKQLDLLGFAGPKDSTIRAWIEEARKLDPDRNPQ